MLGPSRELGSRVPSAQIDWSALAAVFVHPLKRQIIETMSRLDRPMSPSDLVRELAGNPPVSTISYHVKSLANSGVLEALEKEPGRHGKTRTPYKLVASFLIHDTT